MKQLVLQIESCRECSWIDRDVFCYCNHPDGPSEPLEDITIIHPDCPLEDVEKLKTESS